MNARFLPSAARTSGDLAAPLDTARSQAVLPPAGRACCCVAKAVVRVVMPPAPGRPHETELLLCGHHYRASRQALSATHARVEELLGAAAEKTAWFRGEHDRPPASEPCAPPPS